MRIRESIIIEDSILKKIDEIAGQKKRRAATIEKALTEFIAREEKKVSSSSDASETTKAKASTGVKR